MWRHDDARADLALAHGDAHMGQVYFDPDGTISFVDWQSVGLMPSVKDVAYFLGSALPVAERRAHERDLIAHYVQSLEACGGPRLAITDVWEDYRRQMLQGIVWVVVTDKMQTNEAIAALNERYLTAMADLGTLEALGA
jgi:aminoglycoside phosphotransferase (APT) family kinase protein